ncbi:MAG: glycerol-3-phosphate 1-O-acyltransferase PlsY [Phycisphaerales bacterium]|nr:glycerol-3-phosphate 1-O-acyltransferase PlsY [Phycisphaerales bacterium]
MIAHAVFAAGAFLAGSIPTALLIGRAYGIDIRQHGSGNVGATNLGRVLGTKVGVACFVFDVLKGFVPVLAYGLWSGHAGSLDLPARDAWLWLLVAGCAILGHIFTPWLKFKGGKGVATGLGAMLAIYPAMTVPAVCAFAVWILSVKIWRMIGLASVLAAAALPVAALGAFWIGGELARATPFIVVTAFLSLVVIVRHRTNIARALAGTEPKIGEGRPANAEAENNTGADSAE